VLTVVAFASNTGKGVQLTGIWIPISLVILVVVVSILFIRRRR
jgi:hypothetical protein